MNMLYEARQNQEAGMLEVIKSSIRLCADTAMLIGQTKFEILSFRRAKMMPELILNLVMDNCPSTKGTTQNYYNLPKQIKNISETHKMDFTISNKSFTPSSTISIAPHKSPQDKIEPSFLYGGQRASRAEPMVPTQ